MTYKLAKGALWKCSANKATVNRKAGYTHDGKKSLFTRRSQAMTDLVLFSQATALLVISDLLTSKYSLYSVFTLSPFWI